MPLNVAIFNDFILRTIKDHAGFENNKSNRTVALANECSFLDN